MGRAQLLPRDLLRVRSGHAAGRAVAASFGSQFFSNVFQFACVALGAGTLDSLEER
jgi:hypothetical protein